MAHTYYDGQQDAHYGFGRASDGYEYSRGYREECERQEREYYEHQAMKEYEREYWTELAEYEHYLSTRPKDCRP